MKILKRNGLRPKKLAASIAIAVAMPVVGSQFVLAQDNNGSLEEITITGSRIVRRDFEANSPIQTVESEMFENISQVGIEATLNQLPQFIPAATQFNAAGTECCATDTGSTQTAGASTVSLRGLAPNRNLVLIDGRRAVPVNATMAVDINSIPSAAIQRIEVITGGASSVYGADAVAGVVNFILKKDFEGADFDIQSGTREDGTGQESRLSALFGANFGDGKGNVMMGVEMSHRRPTPYENVDFYRDGLLDPTTDGTQLFHSDPYYQIDGANPPAGAVVDGIFDQAAPGTVLGRNANGTIPAGRLHFNDDLSLYTGAAVFGNANPAAGPSAAGAYRYNDPTTFDGLPFRKLDAQGEWEENTQGKQASFPLKRFSMFARGTYEFSEDISAFAQASAVETSAYQRHQYTPAAGGWGALIPRGDGIYEPSLQADGTTTPAYTAGGPLGLNCDPVGGCTKSEAYPVSPELAQVLDSRVNPEDPWSLNYMFDFPQYGKGAPREIETTTRTMQYLFGLEGRLDAIDGSWDATVSHGTSLTQVNQFGFSGLERYRGLVESPNYGKGFFAQGNLRAPGNGFSGGIAQCTSGLPVFRDHADVTQDCLDVFMADLQNNGSMEQNYFVANMQGRVMDLPAGEVRFAAGYEYRENIYQYTFDTLTTQNSYLDLAAGGFPADNTSGETSVNEVYGELFIPLLSDIKGIEHLNLELGYRYSDYELQGGVDTYKTLVDWAINDEVRFRGGYQLATRAPNIAELFQARSQSWGFGVGDMCGLNNIQPNSANPANGAQGAHAQAICEAMMGPVGAADFYDPNEPQPNGFFGLWWANAVGNPDVQPEEATTWTAGVVYQPNSGNALLDGVSATVDWFKIDIEDMIAVEGDSTVYNDCLSLQSNPNADANHPSCSRILRNPTTGNSQAVDTTYKNTGRSTVEGLDVSLNWRGEFTELGIDVPGSFGVNFMVSTYLAFETQASDLEPVLDWKGTLGPGADTSLNQGAYDYRTFTTFNYGLNEWNFNLRWRHLPDAAAAGTVLAGGNPIPEQGAEDSYNIFDFSGSWAMSDNYQLRFGIDNLFDEDPVITGRETDVGGNRPTSGVGITTPGFYDVLGRRYFVGIKGNF